MLPAYSLSNKVVRLINATDFCYWRVSEMPATPVEYELTAPNCPKTVSWQANQVYTLKKSKRTQFLFKT